MPPAAMNTQCESDTAEFVDESAATVELYLSPEEVLTLAQAAEAATAKSPPITSTPVLSTEACERSASSRTPLRRNWWPLSRNTLFIALAMVLITLAGAVSHVAQVPVTRTVSPRAPAATALVASIPGAEAAWATKNALDVPQNPAEPRSELILIEPVRFPNPFDASEIFELPPGTSDTEARRSIANLLLERAHDRLLSLERAHRAARRHAALAKLAKRRAQARRRFASQ